MRQHAIPQNILDIEFKLFTKFTVREFVYMAIGVGFGGIFLYFYTLGKIPGIISFPVFLLSSGLGLFLGLVNINDQKADIFLKNYIWAITHPTQRVWKNKLIDDRLGNELKPEFNVTQGKMEKTDQNGGSDKIFGSASEGEKLQFLEKNKIDQIDKEEKESLENISKLAQGVTPTTVQTELNNGSEEKSKTETDISPTASSPLKSIRIDLNTKSQYLTTLNKPTPYIGNLNFKIIDNTNTPLPQAILVIKDEQNKVLSAIQSDNNGEAMSNRIFPIGTYNIEIQKNGYTFPSIQIIMDKSDLEPILIKAN